MEVSALSFGQSEHVPGEVGMTVTSQAAESSPQDFIIEDPRVPETSLRAIGFTALLLLVGVVFIVKTASIHSQAAIWPRGLAVLLIALTGLRLGLQLWHRAQLGPSASEAVVPAGPLGWAGIEVATWRRIFTAAWLVGYCVVSSLVGFGPAMLVFIPVYMWVCGFRRPLWVAAITIGSAVAMTLLFDGVVHVPIWDARL
jgi:hypothetical protein